MVTREIKQIKWLKIYSPSECISDHNFCYDIPGVTYYDEPYVSEEHTVFLTVKAQEQYKKMDYMMRPGAPKVSVFWKEV